MRTIDDYIQMTYEIGEKKKDKLFQERGFWVCGSMLGGFSDKF